jgi:branched-chain amino acid transport system permease protein
MTDQIVISSLAMGSIYAVVALGFTLIWNASGIVNFAQGEFVMIGAFLGLTLLDTGLPYAAALVVALLGGGLVGYTVERVALRPLRGKSFWASVIATLGIALVLSNGARIIWGPEPRAMPSPLSLRPSDFFGLNVVPHAVAVILIVAVLVIVQDALIRKTPFGRAMRAVSWDSEIAGVIGVNVNRVIGVTFALSAGLAAVAGMLLGPLFFLSPDMGLAVTLKAFAATILGGFGSQRGALIGGMIIAFSESIAGLYLSSDYRMAIVFGIVILVLIIRPKGVWPTAESA